MGTGDETVHSEGGEREEVARDALEAAPEGVLGEGSVDPVYEAKARVLNKAIQDIGMGRYQWQVSRETGTTSLHPFTQRRLAATDLLLAFIV